MEEEARVVVGVPHVGDLPGYFVDSLLSLLSAPPQRFVLQRVERRPTDVARNEIVRSFLALTGATHLFFMDADMTFPRETVQRLLSRDLPIVSGLYVARTELPVPHIYHLDHQDEKGTWYRTDVQALARWLERHPECHATNKAAIYDDPGDSLVEADAIGAGCLLIQREVLERMEPPWFRFNETSGYGGEDFYFCRKAQELGYPIMADLSVHCGHFMGTTVGAIDFGDVFRVGQPDAIDLAKPILVHPGPFGNELVFAPETDFRFPDDVEGYTPEHKCYFLYGLARRVPKDRAVVELGIYKGRSLISLAQAHDAFGVDHFKGECPEELDVPSAAFPDHVRGAYEKAAYDGIERYGLLGKAHIIRDDAFSAGVRWYGPEVGLLVHDAGHSYENVKADIEAWMPHLARDAVLVFDDADFPGVKRVITELGQQGWQFKEAAGSMLALIRKEPE